MQLVTQPLKTKHTEKAFFSGGLVDPAPWLEVMPFHHFDPVVTLCLLLGAGVTHELAVLSLTAP